MNHPCTKWRLGRISELIVGTDGQTRGATLEVSTNGKLSTLVCLLFVLHFVVSTIIHGYNTVEPLRISMVCSKIKCYKSRSLLLESVHGENDLTSYALSMAVLANNRPKHRHDITMACSL